MTAFVFLASETIVIKKSFNRITRGILKICSFYAKEIFVLIKVRLGIVSSIKKNGVRIDWLEILLAIGKNRI